MQTTDTEIRVLVPGDEAALEAFLMPYLSSSMFLVGNARQAGLAYNGQRYGGTYVAAFEAGEMVGVVAHFWNGGLMPQVPEPRTRDLLPVLWRASVAASGRPVKAFIGHDGQASAIMTEFVIPDEIVLMNHREKLYTLALAEMVIPAALAAGQVEVRPATPRDLDTLIGWRVGYETETMGATDSPSYREAVRENLVGLVAEGTVWMLDRAGVPVATTGFNSLLDEVVQVGGVYTPPENRSRGYARCAVAGSLLAMRDQGASVGILFTADSNIPAQRAYEALGFSHIGHFRLCLLSAAAAIRSRK